jgi:hypothetical protein
MELPGCRDLGGEEPDGDGFCPVHDRFGPPPKLTPAAPRGPALLLDRPSCRA